MPALLIRHRVTDYVSWKQVFDDQGSIRRANGCQGGQVFRNTDDPGEVLVLLEWDDLRRARFYSQSDEMLESMRRAEIADDPDLWILERTDTSGS